MNKKVTLSIDREIYKEFQGFCEENAIMLSKRVELFMKDFVKRPKNKVRVKKGGKK